MGAGVADTLSPSQPVDNRWTTKLRARAGITGSLEDWDENATIISMFQKMVKEHPDETAVEDDGEYNPVADPVEDPRVRLTYSELNERAQKTADKLRGLGVRFRKDAEHKVAVVMHRCAAMVVACLGVQMAGAAFVPVDPAYTMERKKFLIYGKKGQDIHGDHPMKAVITMHGVELPNNGYDDEPPKPYLFLDTAASHFMVTEVGSGELPDEHAAEGDTEEAQRYREYREARPDTLSYIFFTSGSTGEPKGVMNEHSAVVNQLKYFQREHPLTPSESVVMGMTTITFDPTIVEFFWPLTVGAKVFIVSMAAQKDTQRINDYMKEVKPAVLQATPTMFQMLVNLGWEGDKDVNIFTGGEALPSTLLPFFRKCKSTSNVYGPTETTIWATKYTAWTPEHYDYMEKHNAPCGTVLQNYYAMILPTDWDEKAQKSLKAIRSAEGETEREKMLAAWMREHQEGGCPLIETAQLTAAEAAGLSTKEADEQRAKRMGILYLGGIGVARGYHGCTGAQELTDKAFLPSPFTALTDGKYSVKGLLQERCKKTFYCTGDLFEWDSKMNLVYKGRIDNQVKVNGQRIEMGEVETQLQRHDAVERAIVMARKDVPMFENTLTLVAYIEFMAGKSATEDDLMKYAGTNLPHKAYVPHHYVFIKKGEWPLGPSKKVDRKKLPVPGASSDLDQCPLLIGNGDGKASLETVIKELIDVAAYFAKGAEIGPDSDIVRIGIDSFMGVQFTNAINKHFEIEFTGKDIRNNPTIDHLARAIHSKLAVSSARELSHEMRFMMGLGVLNGVRGWAVFCVFLYHYRMYWPRGTWQYFDRSFDIDTLFAVIGLTAFVGDEATPFNTVKSWLSFYWAQWWKIFPMYWLGMLANCLCQAYLTGTFENPLFLFGDKKFNTIKDGSHLPNPILAWAMNILGTQSWFGWSAESINTANWVAPSYWFVSTMWALFLLFPILLVVQRWIVRAVAGPNQKEADDEIAKLIKSDFGGDSGQKLTEEAKAEKIKKIRDDVKLPLRATVCGGLIVLFSLIYLCVWITLSYEDGPNTLMVAPGQPSHSLTKQAMGMFHVIRDPVVGFGALGQPFCRMWLCWAGMALGQLLLEQARSKDVEEKKKQETQDAQTAPEASGWQQGWGPWGFLPDFTFLALLFLTYGPPTWYSGYDFIASPIVNGWQRYCLMPLQLLMLLAFLYTACHPAFQPKDRACGILALLNSTALQTWGEVIFPVYLFHLLVLTLFLNTLGMPFAPNNHLRGVGASIHSKEYSSRNIGLWLFPLAWMPVTWVVGSVVNYVYQPLVMQCIHDPLIMLSEKCSQCCKKPESEETTPLLPANTQSHKDIESGHQ